MGTWTRFNEHMLTTRIADWQYLEMCRLVEENDKYMSISDFVRKSIVFMINKHRRKDKMNPIIVRHHGE